MASKKLKLLAISDTHLGEETSLLSFPRGLQHLWQTLSEDEGYEGFWEPVFGEGLKEGEKVEVEELVLVGDIPDRTLSSTSQISASTHAFSMMLGSALEVKKAVYIPGNHDHSLWTDYREAISASSGDGEARTAVPNRAAPPAPAITGPKAESLVEGGRPKSERVREILSIFLGYPRGWAWDEISKHRAEFVFAVANPVYATEVAGRTYAFAHGTHFRPELDSPLQERVLGLLDAAQIDHLVGLEFENVPDLNGARSMKHLEELVTPFVDHLWPSSKNQPTARSDEAWYLITLLSERLHEDEPPPSAEDGRIRYKSEAFPREALFEGPEDRIRRLTDENNAPTDRSLTRFEKFFLKHLKTHLKEGGFSHEKMTFVYGDTHRGGFGELRPTDGGDLIRVYNCGGWVVEPKGRRQQPPHPTCHLFAVDEEGEEYLLDIVFDERAKVGDETVLKLASDDAEHRLEMVGHGVRAVGGALGFVRNSFRR
jgi:hypothetical protein